jgi:hypothetical protein
VRETKCFCTYECFLTVNILFNPLVLPQVVKEWTALKWGKMKHRLGIGKEPKAALVLTTDK